MKYKNWKNLIQSSSFDRILVRPEFVVEIGFNILYLIFLAFLLSIGILGKSWSCDTSMTKYFSTRLLLQKRILVIILILITFYSLSLSLRNEMLTRRYEEDVGENIRDFILRFDTASGQVYENLYKFDTMNNLNSYLPLIRFRVNITGDNYEIGQNVVLINQTLFDNFICGECEELKKGNLFDSKLWVDRILYDIVQELEKVQINGTKPDKSIFEVMDTKPKLINRKIDKSNTIFSNFQTWKELGFSIPPILDYPEEPRTELQVLLFWENADQMTEQQVQNIIADTFEIRHLDIRADKQNVTDHPLQNFADINNEYQYSLIYLGIISSIFVIVFVYQDKEFVQDMDILRKKYGFRQSRFSIFVIAGSVIFFSLLISSVFGTIQGYLFGIGRNQGTYNLMTQEFSIQFVTSPILLNLVRFLAPYIVIILGYNMISYFQEIRKEIK